MPAILIQNGRLIDPAHDVDEKVDILIVDDITFYREPYFLDGTVTEAVEFVTSQGALYFTSAGNFGGNSYEAQFNPGGPDGDNHDFIPGNSGEDLYQSISLTSMDFPFTGVRHLGLFFVNG